MTYAIGRCQAIRLPPPHTPYVLQPYGTMPANRIYPMVNREAPYPEEHLAFSTGDRVGRDETLAPTLGHEPVSDP